MTEPKRNPVEAPEVLIDPSPDRIISASDFAGLAADQRDGAAMQKVSELPSFHEQAWQHGYQQGLRHVMSELSKTLAGLRLCRDDLDTWISQLVFSVLRKVLGHHDAAPIVALIARNAIDDCTQGIASVAVHVHPDTADKVREVLAKQSGESLRIDVVLDATLPSTGCELHTAFGIVDATLDTQLDALENAVISYRQGFADG